MIALAGILASCGAHNPPDGHAGNGQGGLAHDGETAGRRLHGDCGEGRLRCGSECLAAGSDCPIAADPSSLEAPRDGTGLGYLDVTMFDVRRGESIHIDYAYSLSSGQAPCGYDWVLDAGDSEGQFWQNTGAFHCELDALLLTNSAPDRFAGGVFVHPETGARLVRRVLINGEVPDRQSAWGRFEQRLVRAGLPLEYLREGSRFSPVPGATVDVLWSGSPRGGHFQDEQAGGDNDSMVLVISYGGRRILFLSDLGYEGQRALIDRYCPDATDAASGCASLRVDVVKVAQHGAGGDDPRLWALSQPSIALISADPSHPDRVPRRSLVRRLVDAGVRVLSTSAEGDTPLHLRIDAAGAISVQGPDQFMAWDQTGSAWQLVQVSGLPSTTAP